MRDSAAPQRVITIDDDVLRDWPLPQPGEGGKEDRGRVVIVAGCAEIPGAGAGKVTIATPVSIAGRMAFAVPESRVIALEETDDGCIAAGAAHALEDLADKADALLVGPGLAYGGATEALTLALLPLFRNAGIILDAAAMDVAMSSRGLRFSVPVLLTPHAGEMAKLTGLDKDAIVANPVRTALDASKRWNAFVALKNAITHLAAPDGRSWRHEGGNSGLATSGSGDVLAGIIAGLVARGAALEQAAAWGVALHARAGERLAERVGPLGYLARELPAEVPALMAKLSPTRAARARS